MKLPANTEQTNKPLNILVFTAWLIPEELGHTGNFIRHTAQAIAAKGHNVTVVSFSDRQIQLPEFDQQHNQYKEIYLKVGHFSWFARIKMRRMAMNFLNSYEAAHGQVDLIHTHGLVALDRIIQIRRKKAIPVIHTEHLSLLTENTIGWLLKAQVKFLYRYADEILAVSPLLIQNLNQITGRKIHWAGGIVHQDFFNATLQSSQSKTIECICVSDLDDRKGHQVLLEAFAILNDQSIDFRLHLIGDGPKIDLLKQFCIDQKIVSKVIFHGRKQRMDIIQLMQNAAFYTTATLNESFGTHIAEGLAMGLFAITFNSAGPASFVNSSNGLLVDEKNAKALSKAIIQGIERAGQIDKNSIRKSIWQVSHPEIIAENAINVFNQLKADQ